MASRIEKYFLDRTEPGFLPKSIERLPVLTVPNYVVLGQLAALRFIEWVQENPEGVIALPTGRTPEYFIKWFHYYSENWAREVRCGIVAKAGIASKKFPSCKGLHFVQIDEFFPLDPQHERSFTKYVGTYYIDGFGMDRSKAFLIDSFHMPEQLKNVFPPGIDNLEQLFGNEAVDFSLRFRHASGEREENQQKVIRYFDFFCQEYERRIRDLGGIGFFLGGIGPDGHVGFNVRGSSHFSVTRLTTLNYESLAAAAQDMGGIESVRKKAVITIGLGTITYNPETVAIVFVAGQAKAGVVAGAVVNEPHTDFPATALQSLSNARVYATAGAASMLAERKYLVMQKGRYVPDSDIERLIIDGARKEGLKISNYRLSSKKTTLLPRAWKVAEKVTAKKSIELIGETRKSLAMKIEKGLQIPRDSTILHTGPHHDDIELAYFPLIHHLVRSPWNVNHFCYLTSGFTSVTNSYVQQLLESARQSIDDGTLLREITVTELSNRSDRQKEIHGYLNAIAARNRELQELYASMRLVRDLLGYLKTGSVAKAEEFIREQLDIIKELSPGSIDPAPVRELKSRIREWEADTVWAHFGLGVDNVHHLRLKFYTGEIFPNDPQFSRDVVPVIRLLEKVKPSIVTLALDPEGSGPDTHYKCLIALRAAINAYVKDQGDKGMRVWGYRNIWSKFHPAEANTIVPVSLNSFAVLHSMFNSCFVSQKSASFPSFELDGTFAALAQKIWVDQFNDLTSLLGRSYFYESNHPMLRRAFGALYLKDMSAAEFLAETAALEELAESKEYMHSKK